MNTHTTDHGPYEHDRIAEWRRRMMQDNTPRPEPLRLTLAEKIWPWLTVLAFLAVMGLAEHWS